MSGIDIIALDFPSSFRFPFDRRLSWRFDRLGIGRFGYRWLSRIRGRRAQSRYELFRGFCGI